VQAAGVAARVSICIQGLAVQQFMESHQVECLLAAGWLLLAGLAVLAVLHCFHDL